MLASTCIEYMAMPVPTRVGIVVLLILLQYIIAARPSELAKM